MSLSYPFPPIKFHSWYPAASRPMRRAVLECAAELEGYWNQTLVDPSYSSICGLAQDCLLSALQEFTKANFASSAILLGLMPTMLGFIGPSLQDVAVITIHRPLLASLMMVGAPTINPIPLFSVPMENINAKPSAVIVGIGRYLAPGVSHLQPYNKTSSRPWTMPLVAICQYLLVLSALANTIHNTVELDFRTSIVWKCQAVGFIELWVLLSLPISWVAAASLWCRARVKNPSKNRETDDKVVRSNVFRRLSTAMRRWVALEPIPSLFQARPEWTCRIGYNNIASDLLPWLSALLVLINYGFVTLLFSSLLFIGIKDAALVLARFAASAIICRLFLWFEMDSLNLRMQDDGISQATELDNLILQGQDNELPRRTMDSLDR